MELGNQVNWSYAIEVSMAKFFGQTNRAVHQPSPGHARSIEMGFGGVNVAIYRRIGTTAATRPASMASAVARATAAPILDGEKG